LRRTAAVIASLALGVLFILTLPGCPKKCVTPVIDEPVMLEEPESEVVPVVEPTPAGLKLATAYFDFDKSDIRADAATVLKDNADQIKAAAGTMVTIEGHCCPIGTSEYNMALGQRRAEATKVYLVKLGVDASRLSTISYGEERPVTQVEAQYDKNRRAEFKAAK